VPWDGPSATSLTLTGLVQVDDATKSRVEKDIARVKDLGTIKVVVGLAEYLGTRPQTAGTRQQNESFEVSEKSLKGRAVSHGTEYVALAFLLVAIALPTISGANSDRFISSGLKPDSDRARVRNRRTLGTFYFYYRSRGTVPGPPSHRFCPRGLLT
jgi:hypothetical protein